MIDGINKVTQRRKIVVDFNSNHRPNSFPRPMVGPQGPEPTEEPDDKASDGTDPCSF